MNYIKIAKTKHIKNSALIGLILGDGSMPGPKFLYIRHGGKQLDYVNEKVEFLKAYLRPKSLRDGIDKNGFAYRYAYYNDNSLIDLYKLIYSVDGKKKISEKLLNRFTLVSLAFFYMDDGCLSLRKYINKRGEWLGTYKSREIHLCIHSFSWIEAEMFRKMLKQKFDLSFGITTDKGHPRLWCNTENTKKMIKIIEPIVSQFKTMNYKLDLKELTSFK